MNERLYRRLTWIRGLDLVLADGFQWYLPKIDFALMAATTGLQAQMTDIFRLAGETHDQVDETTNQLKTALYHTRMSILAVTLLQINYDMTEAQWERLTMFGSLQKLVGFSEQTSLIFFDTSEVWLPFLKTYGFQGCEALSLN